MKAALALLLTLAHPLVGQVAPGAAGRAGAAPADTLVDLRAGDALSAAREAQRRFERLRRQWSPAARHPWSGSDCDEVVGRICLRHQEGGDWWPHAEDARISGARQELLAALERLASLLPAEPWITGQRILYLGEAGRWEEAERIARACLAHDPARCQSLLGLTLHGQGRYLEAESAFRSGLSSLGEEQRRRWSDPRVVLSLGARGAYQDADGQDAEAASEELIWRLADPLFLVAGNDRLTEHWARWVWATLKDNSANAYALSWGRDLEEVLVRYGWEMGWERVVEPSPRLSPDAIVGHHHPESRGYLPSAEVLRDPAGSSASAWRLSVARPRDGYAPPYAPVIIPARGELLRFPRADRMVVVALYALPDDTTHHARHAHPAFQAPAAFRGLPLQAGLFLLSAAPGPLLEARVTGSARGALLLEAPAGEYLASVEVWSPERGFAGRLRAGVRRLPSTPVTLSDLMLLDAPLSDSMPLETALSRLREPGGVSPGERLTVGWEVGSLDGRARQLSYRLSLRAQASGLLHSIGEWLGISRPQEPLGIAWQESAPSGSRLSLRSISLDLPDLEAGEYILRLELSSAGSSALASERRIQVAKR